MFYEFYSELWTKKRRALSCQQVFSVMTVWSALHSYPCVQALIERKINQCLRKENNYLRNPEAVIWMPQSVMECSLWLPFFWHSKRLVAFISVSFSLETGRRFKRFDDFSEDDLLDVVSDILFLNVGSKKKQKNKFVSFCWRGRMTGYA